MRTTLALILLAGSALSCGDEAGTVAADVRAQLSCPIDPDEVCGGSAEQPVDILGLDGEETDAGTVSASCQLLDGGAGSKLLIFSVGLSGGPTNVRLSGRGIQVPEGGGPVTGTSCQVEMTQGGNTYGGTTLGACGAAPPSEAQPCQFGTFVFDEAGEFGPQITTTLLCRNFRAPTEPGRIVKDLTFPRDDSEPAEIKLINCEGF